MARNCILYVMEGFCVFFWFGVVQKIDIGKDYEEQANVLRFQKIKCFFEDGLPVGIELNFPKVAFGELAFEVIDIQLFDRSILPVMAVASDDGSDT